MGRARHRRKGGRHGQDTRARLCQAAIERGKPHVVTDRHAHRAEIRVAQNRAGAGTIPGAFAVAFRCADLDVKHVDLVIARGDLALRIDHERTVGKAPICITGLERKRADQQPDAQRFGFGSQGGKGRVAALGVQHRLQMRAVGRNDIGDFRGQHETGPLGGGLPHQIKRTRQVRLRVVRDT